MAASIEPPKPKLEAQVDLAFMEAGSFTINDLFLHLQADFAKLEQQNPQDVDMKRYAQCVADLVSGLNTVTIKSKDGQLTNGLDVGKAKGGTDNETDKWTKAETEVFSKNPAFKADFALYKKLIEQREKLIGTPGFQDKQKEVEAQYLKCKAIIEGQYLPNPNMPPLYRGIMMLDKGRESLAGGKYLPFVENETDKAFAVLYMKYMDGLHKNAKNLSLELKNVVWWLKPVIAGFTAVYSLNEVVGNKALEWSTALKARIASYDQSQQAKADATKEPAKEDAAAVKEPVKDASPKEAAPKEAAATSPKAETPKTLVKPPKTAEQILQDAQKAVAAHERIAKLKTDIDALKQPLPEAPKGGRFWQAVSYVASSIPGLSGPSPEAQRKAALGEKMIELDHLGEEQKKAQELLTASAAKVADFTSRCQMFLARPSVDEQDIKILRDATTTVTSDMAKLLEIDDDIVFPADRLELVSQTQEMIRKSFVAAGQKYVEQRISDLKTKAAAILGQDNYFNNTAALLSLFTEIEATIDKLSKEAVFTDPKNNIPLFALYEFKNSFSQQVVTDMLNNLGNTAGKYALQKDYYKNAQGLLDNLNAIDTVVAQIATLQKFQRYAIPTPTLDKIREDFIQQTRKDLITYANEFKDLAKQVQSSRDCEQLHIELSARLDFISDPKLKAFFNTPETAVLELEKIKQTLTSQIVENSKLKEEFVEQAKFKPLAEFLKKYSTQEATTSPIQEAYHKTKPKWVPADYAAHQLRSVDNHLKFLQTIVNQINQLPRENLKNIETQAILIKGALEYFKNHKDLKSTIKTAGFDRFHTMLQKMDDENQALFKAIPNYSNISAPFHKFVKDNPVVFKEFKLADKILNPTPPKPMVPKFETQNANDLKKAQDMPKPLPEAEIKDKKDSGLKKK